MSELKKPKPSDTMIDHAEQHGFIYDEVDKLKNDKSDVDHTHDDSTLRKDLEALKSVVAGLQDAVNEIKDALKLPK